MSMLIAPRMCDDQPSANLPTTSDLRKGEGTGTSPELLRHVTSTLVVWHSVSAKSSDFPHQPTRSVQRHHLAGEKRVCLPPAAVLQRLQRCITASHHRRCTAVSAASASLPPHKPAREPIRKDRKTPARLDTAWSTRSSFPQAQQSFVGRVSAFAGFTRYRRGHRSRRRNHCFDHAP
jgi:hypothetical protein